MVREDRTRRAVLFRFLDVFGTLKSFDEDGQSRGKALDPGNVAPLKIGCECRQ